MCKLGGLIGAYNGENVVNNSGKGTMIENCNSNGRVINNSRFLSRDNTYIGGLIGYYVQGNNRYSISNLYSEAIVRSKSPGNIGGLIGGSIGNVNNSYTNTLIEVDAINDEVSIGGLIGLCIDNRGSEPTIQNSYSNGNIIVRTVNMPLYLGGLIGQSTVMNPSLNQARMKTILKNSFFQL